MAPPWPTWWLNLPLGLIAIFPAALAARSLLRLAATPQSLAPAIQQTIAAAHVAALAMAVGLWLF